MVVADHSIATIRVQQAWPSLGRNSQAIAHQDRRASSIVGPAFKHGPIFGRELKGRIHTDKGDIWDVAPSPDPPDWRGKRVIPGPSDEYLGVVLRPCQI